MLSTKIDITDIFKSRTVSFNTIIMLVVYCISRFFPKVELNPEDIVAVQTFGNIILRFVTNRAIVTDKNNKELNT